MTRIEIIDDDSGRTDEALETIEAVKRRFRIVAEREMLASADWSPICSRCGEAYPALWSIGGTCPFCGHKHISEG